MITTREIKVAMKDMGPRDWIAGVESPEDRHAVTGAFLCSDITNLADRDAQTIMPQSSFWQRCIGKILQL
jgi:hypothetical protein